MKESHKANQVSMETMCEISKPIIKIFLTAFYCYLNVLKKQPKKSLTGWKILNNERSSVHVSENYGKQNNNEPLHFIRNGVNNKN